MAIIGRRSVAEKGTFGSSMSMGRIADKVGVSIATVSRVLNNSPKVHAETRSKVLKVINQVGPSRNSCFGRKHFNIGISLTNFNKGLLPDSFLSECITGIVETTFYDDFRVQILDLLASRKSNETYLECIMNLEIDGLIHVGPSERHSQAIDEIAVAGFKQVLVGARSLDKSIGWVDSENVESSQRAVKYLMSMGHRRIAVITGPLDLPDHQERMAGYCKALKDAGIEPDPALQINTRQILPNGSCTLDLLTRNAGITAIYYTNITLAIGGLRACKSMNIRVPEDISIVAFGDSTLPEYLEPALTYIYQPAIDMGRMAAHQLIGEIKHGAGLRHEEIEPDFLINESTGPRSAAKGDLNN